MILDEYIIKQPKIAEGSYGEVYLAKKKNGSEIFAAKKVEKRKILGQKMKEYFYSEIEILRRLQHENILKLEEIKSTHTSVFIITEFCNGGTLQENLMKYKKIYKTPFPEKIVIYFFKQIASALNYLHEEKVIHRDLKTDNILLHFEKEEDIKNLNFENAKIKLIDFGFAKSYNNKILDSIVGSPLNMDPLILKAYADPKFRKELQYTEKADIYSIGVILFTLLVGKPPFNAGDHIDLFSRVSDGDYSIPKDLKLSVQCIDLLQKVLTKDLEKRLTSQQILESDFLNKKPEEFTYKNFFEDNNNVVPSSDSSIIFNINNIIELDPKNDMEENMTKIEDLNLYIDGINENLKKKEYVSTNNINSNNNPNDENNIFGMSIENLDNLFTMINKPMESLKFEPVPMNLDNPKKYENFLI